MKEYFDALREEIKNNVGKVVKTEELYPLTEVYGKKMGAMLAELKLDDNEVRNLVVYLTRSISERNQVLEQGWKMHNSFGKLPK